VAKDLKFLDRHELSRLSFAVFGLPFNLVEALSLDFFPDGQTLIKFIPLVLCHIFPINTTLMHLLLQYTQLQCYRVSGWLGLQRLGNSKIVSKKEHHIHGCKKFVLTYNGHSKLPFFYEHSIIMMSVRVSWYIKEILL
jgi:hypothetical protein